MKKSIIILYGPTATGKSDCATKLACEFPLEIINGDVGQLYAPLSIGTAKPDWKNEKAPHHLFDILNEPSDYTVVNYRVAVVALCEQIWARGNIPCIVGGSGFYLKSLFFAPEPEVPDFTESIRVIPTIDDLSDEDAWQLLARYDAVRAAQIHPHDRYRIERAFTILKTKQTASGQQPRYTPLDFPVLFLCLTRDRKALYDRINHRTQLMIYQGWIEEVIQLEGTPWASFLKKKKLIGYSEIFEYLKHSEITKSELIRAIAQKTRHYAKRQMTFWRLIEKQLGDCVIEPSCLALCESSSDDDMYTQVYDQVRLFLTKI